MINPDKVYNINQFRLLTLSDFMNGYLSLWCRYNSPLPS